MYARTSALLLVMTICVVTGAQAGEGLLLVPLTRCSTVSFSFQSVDFPFPAGAGGRAPRRPRKTSHPASR